MNLELAIKVGASAPDLILKTHLYKQFQLSQIERKNVLLSFHPLAWTSVCAKQMKSLEENKQKFEELNTVAVGISVDPVPSKKAWAESLGIKETSLLSDFWPHGEVAKLYGIFRDKEGVSERANVIIDQFKKIQFFEIYEMNKLPDISKILDELKTLQEGKCHHAINTLCTIEHCFANMKKYLVAMSQLSQQNLIHQNINSLGTN